ncbi:MAG TPA: DUF5615 family PIN-like protein [Tepidisphaeraceae bacterium]|nr:DUF5615 family PIN-like protein [Tepidisphaeraceae bacterium]
MRVKLDEDLSHRLGELLGAHGHVALTVRGQGWGGLKDPQLWPRVLAENIFFVTADKGFGDIRAYPPGTHPGILLLRTNEGLPSEFRSLLEMVLRSHALEEHAGCLMVATSRGVRVRRPPEKSQ